MVRVGSRKATTPRARSTTGKRPPDRQARIANQQSTVDKWSRGTEALEAKMATQRSRRHAFEPMGRLPACERCGSGVDELINGKRIHFEQR